MAKRKRRLPAKPDDGFDAALTRNVIKYLLPSVRESSASVSICPPGEPDVKFLLELGALVYYGKPIIVIGLPGVTIPEGMKRIAAATLENINLDDDASRVRVEAAIRKLTEDSSDG
jgi:hypothetical protein